MDLKMENSKTASCKALANILSFTSYLKSQCEVDSEVDIASSQIVIGLILRQITTLIIAQELREECSFVAEQIITESSGRLNEGSIGKTPLNDFVARLANPSFLSRYTNNLSEVVAEVGLAEQWLTDPDRGLLRVRLIQELEKAGFAPLVSNKFGIDPASIETTVTMTLPPLDVTHIDVTKDTTTTNKQIAWQRSAIEDIDKAIRYFNSPVSTKKGSLKVVGTGIRSIVDLTYGAEMEIRSADKVLYCVADPVTERKIHRLNKNSESLYRLYGNGKPRLTTYKEMVEMMMGYVHLGLSVCAVFYGHPGVFAWSTHEAIRQAREEGYSAEMMPAISTEASLLADLGLDPSTFGIQSLEATDFLVRRRSIDTSCHILLWQIECVGDFGFNFTGYEKQNFPILIEALQHIYPEDHPVIVYDGSQFPQFRSRIQKLNLSTISSEHLSGISTLYLPPAKTPEIDEAMWLRLGLPQKDQLE